MRTNNKNEKQPSKSNHQKGLVEITPKNLQDNSKKKFAKNEPL